MGQTIWPIWYSLYLCCQSKQRWIFYCIWQCDCLCLYRIIRTFLNCPDLTGTGLPFSVFIIQNVFDLDFYDIESIIIIIDKETALFSRVDLLLLCISYLNFWDYLRRFWYFYLLKFSMKVIQAFRHVQNK